MAQHVFDLRARCRQSRRDALLARRAGEIERHDPFGGSERISALHPRAPARRHEIGPASVRPRGTTSPRHAIGPAQRDRAARIVGSGDGVLLLRLGGHAGPALGQAVRLDGARASVALELPQPCVQIHGVAAQTPFGQQGEQRGDSCCPLRSCSEKRTGLAGTERHKGGDASQGRQRDGAVIAFDQSEIAQQSRSPIESGAGGRLEPRHVPQPVRPHAPIERVQHEARKVGAQDGGRGGGGEAARCGFGP